MCSASLIKSFSFGINAKRSSSRPAFKMIVLVIIWYS
jgi:hypothetical protein